MAITYRQEIDTLYSHIDIIEIASGNGRVAVSPQLQGRVLTSCTDPSQSGFGWLNHKLIKSGKPQPHINAYGGEDRFWLGPESGQFALFFQPGQDFTMNNWQTPACVDSEPFELVSRSEDAVELTRSCNFSNYQAQAFEIRIDRRIQMLHLEELTSNLDRVDINSVDLVGYASHNSIENLSSNSWRKETGLLNIWILGKFKPGKDRWAIIPTKEEAYVNQNYFEADLTSRLLRERDFSILHVDGRQKAKIGIAPIHDKNVLGSFDFETNTLTVVSYETDKNEVFLNSEWNIQEKPYAGDVLNVYNDGPDSNGTVLGPYYELETSSSSRALNQGEQIIHTHTTKHFTGDFNELNKIARTLLETDLNTIKNTIHAG